jgi:hypothetical protein
MVSIILGSLLDYELTAAREAAQGGIAEEGMTLSQLIRYNLTLCDSTVPCPAALLRFEIMAQGVVIERFRCA